MFKKINQTSGGERFVDAFPRVTRSGTKKNPRHQDPDHRMGHRILGLYDTRTIIPLYSIRKVCFHFDSKYFFLQIYMNTLILYLWNCSQNHNMKPVLKYIGIFKFFFLILPQLLNLIPKSYLALGWQF